jgi:hypothetical protein
MRSSKLDSRSDDWLIGTTQAAWERWQNITRTLRGRDPEFVTVEVAVTSEGEHGHADVESMSGAAD